MINRPTSLVIFFTNYYLTESHLIPLLRKWVINHYDEIILFLPESFLEKKEIVTKIQKISKFTKIYIIQRKKSRTLTLENNLIKINLNQISKIINIIFDKTNPSLALICSVNTLESQIIVRELSRRPMKIYGWYIGNHILRTQGLEELRYIDQVAGQELLKNFIGPHHSKVNVDGFKKRPILYAINNLKIKNYYFYQYIKEFILLSFLYTNKIKVIDKNNRKTGFSIRNLDGIIFHSRSNKSTQDSLSLGIKNYFISHPLLEYKNYEYGKNVLCLYSSDDIAYEMLIMDFLRLYYKKNRFDKIYIKLHPNSDQEVCINFKSKLGKEFPLCQVIEIQNNIGIDFAKNTHKLGIVCGAPSSAFYDLQALLPELKLLVMDETAAYLNRGNYPVHGRSSAKIIMGIEDSDRFTFVERENLTDSEKNFFWRKPIFRDDSEMDFNEFFSVKKYY